LAQILKKSKAKTLEGFIKYEGGKKKLKIGLVFQFTLRTKIGNFLKHGKPINIG
jgi:hypothetical protein